MLLALVASACGGDEDCSLTNSCPNQAPSVTIEQPATGTTVDEFTAVSFQGSATDSEDGAIPASELVWTSSVDGVIGTGTSFVRNDLTPGAHVIRLNATDSEGQTGTDTVTLTIVDIVNEKPNVTISSPADGGSAEAGVSVTFTGSATDPEDGPIGDAALAWTSDLDGPIGMGSSFSRNDLTGGTHEIVLTATDNEGAFGADTITFTITGAPNVTISSPTANADESPRTVTVGGSVTFTGSANDTQDGMLTGTALVWTSNVDGQIGTGTSFGTSALSAGMHTVTLSATDSDGNEAEATVLVIVKPPAAPGFQIHIRNSEGVELSPAQQEAVDSAVADLQAIITGDLPDLPSADFQDIGTCGGASIPKLTESVDDVIIYLEFVPIDQQGGVLGSAGPCFVRNGTAFSLIGGMRFDQADLAFLETIGLLDDIIVHEMMHVLGFGIFWDSPVDYLEQPSNPSHPDYVAGMTDTHFTGPNALAWFDSIGGNNYTGGEIVPVANDTADFSEGSLDGHWRESVFGNELMTPAANVPPPNPLSVLTVAQFEDLGYTVDYDAAEPYVQVFSIVLAPRLMAPAIDLSGDVWRGPIYAVAPAGGVRRIR